MKDEETSDGSSAAKVAARALENTESTAPLRLRHAHCMPLHATACHTIPCHNTMHQGMPCLLRHAALCHIIACCVVPQHTTPCLATPCHAMSYTLHITPRCGKSRHATRARHVFVSAAEKKRLVYLYSYGLYSYGVCSYGCSAAEKKRLVYQRWGSRERTRKEPPSAPPSDPPPAAPSSRGPSAAVTAEAPDSAMTRLEAKLAASELERSARQAAASDSSATADCRAVASDSSATADGLAAASDSSATADGLATASDSSATAGARQRGAHRRYSRVIGDEKQGEPLSNSPFQRLPKGFQPPVDPTPFSLSTNDASSPLLAAQLGRHPTGTESSTSAGESHNASNLPSNLLSVSADEPVSVLVTGHIGNEAVSKAARQRSEFGEHFKVKDEFPNRMFQ